MATMIPDVAVISRPDAGEARVYVALKELPDTYRIAVDAARASSSYVPLP